MIGLLSLYSGFPGWSYRRGSESAESKSITDRTLKMKMKRLSAFFGLLALAGAVSARADNIAYTDPASQGVQGFGGNLALNFNVLSPTTVTELGMFNASGSGTIAGTIQVVIYNTGTNTAVTPVVTFSGNYTSAGLGYDVFQAITPVVLGVGSYEVDAVGFSASDPNGNINIGSSGPLLNDFAGSLAFTGASYDGSPVLDDPSSCPGCASPPAQSSQFDAGTFGNGTVVTTVPEPSSLILFGTGVLGLGMMAFRRKSALARPN
jgi:hypothetical protein